MTMIDHALTRPWTVDKRYVRNPDPHADWPEYYCSENNAQIVIDKENYFLSADGLLMPTQRPGAAGFEIFQSVAEIGKCTSAFLFVNQFQLIDAVRDAPRRLAQHRKSFDLDGRAMREAGLDLCRLARPAASFFRHLFRCGCRFAADGEVFELLARFDRGAEPARLEAPAGPGLGRVLGIAVFRGDGSRERKATAGANAACTHMAIAEAGELSEFGFKLAPLLDHFRAQHGLDLRLQLRELFNRHRLEVPTAGMVWVPRIIIGGVMRYYWN